MNHDQFDTELERVERYLLELKNIRTAQIDKSKTLDPNNALLLKEAADSLSRAFDYLETLGG